MVSITTRYEKIGDERKKVFMVRGEEAYAKTVDLEVNYTRKSSSTNNANGFLVKLTGTLYRNIGSSSIIFYDGETELGAINTTEYSSDYELDDIRLAWGVEHDIYAKYKSNKQTLGKRSKTIHLYEELPENYTPVITFTSGTQVNDGATVTVAGTVKLMNVAVADGTELNIYCDDELIDTVTTEDGIFQCEMTGLASGQHTIVAETVKSSTMNVKSKSITVKVGYNIIFLEYPNPFITGETNTFRIAVKKYDGASIVGGTVVFNGASYTTDSNGVATITLTSLTAGEYTATYHGTTSAPITITTKSLPSINVTTDKRVISKGYVLPLTFRFDNTYSQLPVKVYEDNVLKTTLNPDTNGLYSYNFKGTGRGKCTVKLATDSVETELNMIDCYMQHSVVNGTYNSRIIEPFNQNHVNELPNNYLGLEIEKFSPIYIISDNVSSDGGDANVLELKCSRVDGTGNLTVEAGTYNIRDNNGYIVTYTATINIPYEHIRNAIIKIKVYNGVIKYYKNGTLIATESTDIPTGGKINTWSLYNNNNQTANLTVSDLYMYQELNND